MIWPLRPVRVAPVVLMVVAAVAVATIADALTGHSAAQQGAGEASPVTVELVSQSTSVGPDQDWNITLRVRGAQDADPVRVAVHPRVEDRAELRDILADGTPPARMVTAPLEHYRDVVDPTSGLVQLQVPFHATNRLPGVYPVSVTVALGTPRATSLVTTMIRLPEPDPDHAALGVALVVPVQTGTALAPDGTASIVERELDRLESLAVAFGDHAPSLPLTLAPNPETLDGLDRGNPDHREVLARLRRAATDREIIPDTYVPVDHEAWRRAGMGDLLGVQREAATATIGRTLAPAPTSVVADIAILGASDNADTVALRRALGAERLVVREQHLRALDPDRFPSTLVQSFVLTDAAGHDLRALVADDHLGALLQRMAGPTPGGQRVQLAHRILADLAAAQLQHPEQHQGTVVMLPTTWTDHAAARQVLLDGLVRLPILEPMQLTELFDTTGRASPEGSGSSETMASGSLRRRLAPQAPMELGSYPTALREARDRLAGLDAMFEPGTELIAELEDLLLVSGDARLGEHQRQRYLDTVTGHLDRLVEPPDGGAPLAGPASQRVTMTSRTAAIPIEIENRLAYPATVRIELRSDKLEFPDGQTFEHTLEPGSNVLEVTVRSKTSGDSRLEIDVLPPHPGIGVERFTSGTYTIRSTALSGVGVVLGSLALGVLVLWWVRHARANRRESRHRRRRRDPGSGGGHTPAPTMRVPQDPSES